MAAVKNLETVTLELSVENGLNADGDKKYKNVDYKQIATSATPDQLEDVGSTLGGLMQKTPAGIYVVEKHKIGKGE